MYLCCNQGWGAACIWPLRAEPEPEPLKNYPAPQPGYNSDVHCSLHDVILFVCFREMASQTQGIQQLLAAEKRAAEKVQYFHSR